MKDGRKAAGESRWGAPGRSHDLSRFDSGHVGPCVGGLLPICCPAITCGWRRGHEADESAGPDDRDPLGALVACDQSWVSGGEAWSPWLVARFGLVLPGRGSTVILALFPRRSSCCHKGVGAWLGHRSSLLIRSPRSPVGWRWSSPIRRGRAAAGRGGAGRGPVRAAGIGHRGWLQGAAPAGGSEPGRAGGAVPARRRAGAGPGGGRPRPPDRSRRSSAALGATGSGSCTPTGG